ARGGSAGVTRGAGAAHRHGAASGRGILPALARRSPRLAFPSAPRPHASRARRGARQERQPRRTGHRSGRRARRVHGDPRVDRLPDRHVLPRALHGEAHPPAALAARPRYLATRRRRLVSPVRRVAEGAIAARLMEILSLLGSGFAIALTPANLFYCFVGSLVGTAIGVLPGLGPPATIALLLPVTYGIPATSAVILLARLFYGAMYGGSTTSILLNIPGEAASVVTCLDGYQMARQGRAGAALAVSAVGSFIAGTIGVVGLMLLAPPLASFALKFGAPENAAL